MSTASHEVTRLLLDWRAGDHAALDQLMPLVYHELHQQAARYLRRERPDHTLQATALVHEAYLQLVDQPQVNWQNRAHFFGAAAQAMRRILVDSARAEELTREALAMRRKIYGNEHSEVADSLNDLALLTKLKGDFATAEPLYRETIAVQRKLLGEGHPKVATTLGNLAILLVDKKDFAEAEAAQREALAIRRKTLGEDAPDVALTLHNLASILRRKKDYPGAEQVLRETLALRRKLYPAAHPDLALTIYNLGTLMLDQKKHDAAETFLREALAMRLKVMPNDHQFIGRTKIELGRVLVRKNELTAALPLLNEGLRNAQNAKDTGYIPHALDGLGELNFGQKKFAEAEVFYLAGYEQYQTLKDAQRAQEMQKKLVDLYEAWGKPAQAAPYKALLAQQK